ncbi:MAG: tetratricopeptide repeat protein [Pseudomonadota bacterium]
MRVSQEDAAKRQQVDQAFVQARGLQSEGNYERARQIYEQILVRFPYHSDSLTLLASLCYQQGEDTQAEAYLDRAIEAQRYILQRVPEAPTAWAPLANLLLVRGQTEEAEAICARLDLPLNSIRADRQVFVDRRNAAMLAGMPPMLITTLPKSASESIWNRLAEGLALAQSHISMGLFPDCCILGPRARTFAQGGVIAKEHIAATTHNLAMLSRSGVRRVLVHLRDPRQATVSWAHFVKEDVSMRLLAPIWRRIVPPASVLAGGLQETLDWSIDHYLPLQIDWVRGWIEAGKGTDIEVLFLDFEGFKSDENAYFSQVLRFFAIDPQAFRQDLSAQAETVHLRRGETDEWRGAMNSKQQARAAALLPDVMVERFGWQR